MIPQNSDTASHPTYYCEILFGRRKIVYTDLFFKATNIWKNVQNVSLYFEGLLHKDISKEPFINQEISYINGNLEMKFSTVSDYIKKVLIMIEIEKNVSHIL